MHPHTRQNYTDHTQHNSQPTQTDNKQRHEAEEDRCAERKNMEVRRRKEKERERRGQISRSSERERERRGQISRSSERV